MCVIIEVKMLWIHEAHCLPQHQRQRKCSWELRKVLRRWHIADASRVVWTRIDNGVLANRIARLVALVSSLTLCYKTSIFPIFSEYSSEKKNRICLVIQLFLMLGYWLRGLLRKNCKLTLETRLQLVPWIPGRNFSQHHTSIIFGKMVRFLGDAKQRSGQIYDHNVSNLTWRSSGAANNRVFIKSSSSRRN